MIGVWDASLFAAYRAAPDGPRKRAMENRLYLENEPLVKTLVAQMLGTGKPGRHIPAALRRIHRAEVVESWEDAMGVAGVAFAKFLRDYDPASGKISFFLGMKIRYELQCIIERSTNIKVPRDYEAESLPQGYERYETEADMERAAHSSGLEMAPDRELELMALGRAEEQREAEATRVYSIPRPTLDVFLEVRLVFGGRGNRAEIWPLWNAWRVLCARERTAAGTRGRFVGKLAERGAREFVTRVRGESTRMVCGARLVA